MTAPLGYRWSASPGKPAPDSDAQAYREIGSPESMRGKPMLFFVERRGGYPWAEGYFNRNDDLPLPAKLANHGRPSLFPIRIYPSGITKARLSVLLFQARREDKLEIAFNGRVLSGADVGDWKDPQIFSPKPQPASGGKGDYRIDPAQRLLRLSFDLPSGIIKRGANEVSVRVLDRPMYRIGEDVQVEKIEVAAG